MRKYLISCILLILTVSFSIQAQEDLSVYSPRKLKKLGKVALRNNDAYKAIRYYEALVKVRPDYKTMFLLAECYRYTRNYTFAQHWYEKAYKENPKKNGKALYYYATMLKTAQDYTNASSQFKIFKKEYISAKDAPIFQKITKQQILSCDSAVKAIANPKEVRVINLGNNINSPGFEYMPIYITPTSFIYASKTFDSIVGPEKDPNFSTGSKYGITWLNNGDWDLKADGEKLKMNHGAFSTDFQRFYFTQCSIDGKYEVCKAYVTKNVFGVWQKPEELPEIINVPDANIFYIAVGNESKKNNEVIYFVTDREGGQGGLDIWFSTFEPKKNLWREPKNCGNKINSGGDEHSPYYDQTKRVLYFSSNGWKGLGEHDIYRANGELGKFTPGENMGYPINSPADDYYFSVSSDGKNGLFASNRDGSQSTAWPNACDDIFLVNFDNVFDIPVLGKVYEIEDAEISSILKNNFATTEAEQESGKIKYIKGSTVSLFMGNSNDKIFIGTTQTDARGEYNFIVEPGKEYILQFEHAKTGTAYHPFSTVTATTPDTIYIKDFGINYIDKDGGMQFKNVYYEFGKYRLTKEHKAILDTSIIKLMRSASEIVVELSSHTDNIGGSAMNMKLSQRRADAIIEYVVKEGGIAPHRITGKGYGFTKPVAPNTRPDGKDYPEGRAKNRRTEIRVLGSVDNVTKEDLEEIKAAPVKADDDDEATEPAEAKSNSIIAPTTAKPASSEGDEDEDEEVAPAPAKVEEAPKATETPKAEAPKAEESEDDEE